MAAETLYIRKLGDVSERNVRYADMTIEDALRQWSIREVDTQYLYAVVELPDRTRTYSVARDGEVVRGFVGN